MILEEPGKITERIWLLGRKESCVYLLDGGDDWVLIGGGLVYIIPDIIDQLRQMAVDTRRIRRIMILHAHFDHCGIVGFFKKQWPWVRITASSRAKDLLATPKVVAAISGLNQALLAELGLERKIQPLGIESYAVEVEDVVKGGDILACGDRSLEVIDVPGHSSCSVAVYVPEEKAMFASDAGGIPLGDRVFTAANSNYDQYLESLARMAAYDVEVFLAEHFGARTGKDGREYFQKSLAAAQETRRLLEATYARSGDLAQSVREVTDILLERMPAGFMSREVFGLVIGQMMAYIAKQQRP